MTENSDFFNETPEIMPEETTSVVLPTVAIVGRPNVGKSSLFNAIIGRRLAIVHEQSGVTRDRVATEAHWENRAFTLVDTGGLGMMDGKEKNVDFWDAGIAEQVKAALEDAAVLIFVTDAQSGLTPLDADVAKRLRSCGKPVFMAVNKCDTELLKNDAAEFSRFGFGTVYPICCTRKGGIANLMNAVINKCNAVPVAQIRKKPALDIAVVGRPNVGKSSLINALLGEKRLMTSPIAGTTRDAIKVEFSITDANGGKHPAKLVDTAGLRKGGKVDNVVELFSIMRAKSAIERSDLVIFVVEAGMNSITAQDRKIASLIENSGRACVVAANKIDLCPNLDEKSLMANLRKSIPQLNFAPVVFISAEQRLNFTALENKLAEVDDNSRTEITTGLLNRILAETMENTPPPVVSSVPLKLYYAALAGIRPPRIKLFVNKVEAAAENYLTFLKKKLRENFSLSGIPLALEVCARPKKVESIRSEKRRTSTPSPRRSPGKKR